VELPLWLKFFLIIILSIMAINCIVKIALEGELESHRVRETPSFLNNSLLQRSVLFSHQPLVNIFLKSFFLFVTAYFLFDSISYKLAVAGAHPGDFRWFYVASKMVKEGISPFNPESFITYFSNTTDPRNVVPFPYPISIIPIILPIGYFSLPRACTIWALSNLVAIAFLVWGATVLLNSNKIGNRIICLTSCLLLNGTTYGISNISIFVAALLVWSIIFAKSDKNLLAGILLGISTIKPSISLLFLVYFLLKRRFSIVGWAILTLLILSTMGLLISRESPLSFLAMYKASYKLWSEHYYNNPYTSTGRIDLGVIGPRLFPKSLGISKLLSGLFSVTIFAAIVFYIYRVKKSLNWFKDVVLAEVALIACLSIMVVYSQPTNNVILVLVIVFLLNQLIAGITNNDFSEKKMFLWIMAVCCLIVHTNLVYYFLDPFYELRNMPLLLRTTIGSLPNYSLIGLFINTLFLAISNAKKRGSSLFSMPN